METEKQLVNRCLAGDGAAFAALLDAHQERIYSFALRLLGNEPDAEDAAQDTFVRAFRSLADYDQARPFHSWLFGIAHNRCLDLLRARRPGFSLDEEEAPELPDNSTPVDLAVEAVLEGERIERLLAELPPLYSEILILQYREGLNGPELARVLAIPEGTVKVRLFRARALLKKKLETIPGFCA